VRLRWVNLAPGKPAWRIALGIGCLLGVDPSPYAGNRRANALGCGTMYEKVLSKLWISTHLTRVSVKRFAFCGTPGLIPFRLVKDAKTLDTTRDGTDRIMATGLMSQSTGPLRTHLLRSELQSKRASLFAP
jgi:hypothetical protein